MAEDMIEAGARALFERDPPTLRHVPWTWDTAIGPAEYFRENKRLDAFVVLEAALNPDNEAVVEKFGRRLHDHVAMQHGLPRWDQYGSDQNDHRDRQHARYRRHAKDYLRLLSQMAQGHPSSQEQVRASLSDTEREDGK